MATAELDLPDAHGSASAHASVIPARRRPWVAAAALAASGVLLFFAYLAQARTIPAMSDGASQALQAWDMLHGNVLLRGWSLSDVSFYTTELPEYMLVELARGLTGDVVHVAAAVTYTLLVLLAALVAKGRATGREALVRMLVTAGIVLAPPLGMHNTTSVVLSNPDHTGTQVPLLAIWLLLDRARPRWWVPVVVTVSLAWVQIADLTALFEGVVPLVAVCAVRMYRRRGPLSGQWYDLALAAGAVASAVAATTALVMIRTAGGFAVRTPTTVFAGHFTLSGQLWPKIETLLVIYGADFFGQPATHALIPLAHLVAVVLVAWGVAYAVRRFFAGDDLVARVLTAAFAVVLAAYMFGFRVGAWEVIGLLPIGAVLAGRLLAGRLIRGNLLPALTAVLVCYGLLLLHNVTRPAAPSQNERVGAWLEARHLNYGLAEFWRASSVTLDTGNRVEVRPVITAGGKIVLTHWESRASWYNPRLHDARFVISGSLSVATLREAFGRPARTYRVDGYLVLVWHKNLLDSHSIVSEPPITWKNILAAAGPRQRHIS